MRRERLKVTLGIKLKTYAGALAVVNVSNMGVLELPTAVS
jgi:hypothetical protein